METVTMPSTARVWIYQANRTLQENEMNKVMDHCRAFVQQWAAHGQSLAADVIQKYNRFVIFVVDEQVAQVTGCSIDKSVKLMQDIGAQLDVDFFDRMQITYLEDGELKDSRMHDFWAMRKANVVSDETTVFNNLLQTWGEFQERWEGPFAQSWHADMW